MKITRQARYRTKIIKNGWNNVFESKTGILYVYISPFRTLRRPQYGYARHM